MPVTRYVIMPPTIRWRWKFTNPLLVKFDSPKSHKLAVERIARYFQREFGYDFLQYTAEGASPSMSAYLWVQHPVVENFAATCIGAAGFVTHENSKRQHLNWVWLHPFCRRQGYLTRAWPTFRASHGDFTLEHPLSEAMEKFLETVTQ